MFVTLNNHRPWSQVALYAVLVSIVMTAILSLADGLVALESTRTLYYPMYRAWVSDFRYLFEQGVYAGILLFVGAKFFETRTILTIGFDRADAARMRVKGPDADNIVWIGRRYDSALEAQAVVDAMTERLKASA